MKIATAEKRIAEMVSLIRGTESDGDPLIDG